MRTTIDIPDPIYRQLKAKAALRGCSVREIILRGVEVELDNGRTKKKGHRVKLPIIESKRRDSLKLTNKMIDELLFP